MANGIGILGGEFVTLIILPFLLIFVVIFAILEKTEILGKDRRQINAIVSFVFAAISIAIPAATGVITRIIPVISVIIVILLAFMLVFGFIGGTEKGGLSKGLRIAFGIILGISLIITVLWATGGLPTVAKWGEIEEFWPTFTLILLIIAVFSVVLTAKPSEASKEKSIASRERE